MKLNIFNFVMFLVAVSLIVGFAYFYYSPKVTLGIPGYTEVYQSIPAERNDFGLALLGFANVREPIQGDLIKGYAQNPDGSVFVVFESNHLETKDFGQTCIWRIR